MRGKKLVPIVSVGLFLLVSGSVLSAQASTAVEVPPIQLEKVEPTGGKPLMESLALRRSIREFSDRQIPEAVLSKLLWAADGVNRPDGKRTAPSAWNRQTVEIYVVTAAAAYRYVPDGHRLEPVVAGDFRALTGVQPFVATAPMNLVYVADLGKLEQTDSPADEKVLMAAVEAGHIAQNVYLFCASEGLGAVTRMLIDREPLAEALQLRAEQHIISAQSVGYPAASTE